MIDLRAEMYEKIISIQKEQDKEIYMVRHALSKKTFIMKILHSSFDVHLYDQLMKHPHPNMANVVEYDKNADQLIVVEEYVNGTTLEYEMSSGMSSKMKISIIMELLDVLDHLHHLCPPVIHRDIKPGNIMLENHHVKLIDFEIARNVLPNKEKDTQILGSVGYAAPEQYGFAQSDQRSDIYAIGILIKELFSSDVGGERYQPLIDRCLKLDPDARYADIKELRKDFVRFNGDRKFSVSKKQDILQSWNVAGFRGESLFVKICILLYFVFVLCFSMMATSERLDHVPFGILLLKLCLFVILMLILWVPTNSFHLLEMFPMHRSPHKLIRFFNGCLVWLCSAFLILLVTSFISTSVAEIFRIEQKN